MTAVDLDNIRLSYGGHRSRADGMCLLEAVAFLAGEPHSDHPQCVCPVLAAFGRAWNDALPDDDRNRLLRPFIPRLVGTRSSPAVERQRAYMVADWAVRVATPVWLRAAGLEYQAAELAGLAPLHTVESFAVAQPVIARARATAMAAARGAADAAWDAGMAAIEAAAGDAATAAPAMAAARAAARGDAMAAARAANDAAEYAAVAAAAAGGALRPHVEQLQASAVDLYRRMIEVTPS